jgi:cytochrome P450
MLPNGSRRFRRRRSPIRTDTDADLNGIAPLDLLDSAMYSIEGRRDPYPFLSDLVSREPFHVLGDGRSFVFGYHECLEALRSRSLLKHGEHVSSTSPSFTQEQLETLRRERPDGAGMLSSIDDPDHARLRRLVTIAFSPKEIDKYAKLIADTLDEQLALLDRREPIDLVSTLHSKIPSQVVGHLIGLPLPDRDHFARLASLQSVGRNPEASFDEQLVAVRARREMYEYVADLIESERSNPGDTPVGRLIRLEQGGEEISRSELISLVATVYSAGFGTTVRMLGNGTVALLRSPRNADYLRSNPERARQVTDELLRYDTPVMTVAYFADENAAVGGQQLEPGSLCTIMLGAANRDPTVFDAPDVLNVEVERKFGPLSFGFGSHYCLGHALARLEGDIVFTEMVSRFPRMALAEEPTRQDTFRARAFTRIPVVLEPT